MPEAPPPAWVELKPRPGRWVPADEALATRLVGLLRIPGRLVERDPVTPGARGFYALHPSDGSRSIFLKVVSGQRARSLQSAETIVDYLAGCDIPVSAMLPGFPQCLDDDDFVFGYPLLEYRFSTPTAADMQRIGRLLAGLHRHLRQVPEADKVRERSLAMDDKLARIRESLPDRQTRIVPSDLRSVPHTYPDVGAQPVHGDLNYGNLLFDQSGQPVLIDFENCLHSWYSPAVDLAWIVERHILVHTPDDARCLDLCEVLLRNYVQSADSPPRELDLASLFATKVLRPLLLLSGSDEITPEIEKFHFLHGEIQRRGSLLSAIDTLYQSLRTPGDTH